MSLLARILIYFSAPIYWSLLDVFLVSSAAEVGADPRFEDHVAPAEGGIVALPPPFRVMLADARTHADHQDGEVRGRARRSTFLGSAGHELEPITTLAYGQSIKDVREAVRVALRVPRRLAKIKLLLPHNRELGSVDYPWDADSDVLTAVPVPDRWGGISSRGRMRTHGLPPPWPIPDSYYYAPAVLPVGQDLRAVVEPKSLREGEDPASFAAEVLFDLEPMEPPSGGDHGRMRLFLTRFASGRPEPGWVRGKERYEVVVRLPEGNGIDLPAEMALQVRTFIRRTNPKAWSVTVADSWRSLHPVFTQLERSLYSIGEECPWWREVEALVGGAASAPASGEHEEHEQEQHLCPGPPSTALGQLFARLPLPPSTEAVPPANGLVPNRFFGMESLTDHAERMGRHVLLEFLLNAAEGDTFLLHWLNHDDGVERPDGRERAERSDGSDSDKVVQEFILARTSNGVDVIQMKPEPTAKNPSLNMNERLHIAYEIDVAALRARVENRARIVPEERPSWARPGYRQQLIWVGEEDPRDEEVVLDEEGWEVNEEGLRFLESRQRRLAQPWSWYDEFLRRELSGARLVGPRRGLTAAEGARDVGPAVPEMLKHMVETFASVEVVAAGRSRPPVHHRLAPGEGIFARTRSP